MIYNILQYKYWMCIRVATDALTLQLPIWVQPFSSSSPFGQDGSLTAALDEAIVKGKEAEIILYCPELETCRP